MLAGHDVSAGGLVTALLEMTFADNRSGMDLSFAALGERDVVRLLFSEKPALVLQVEDGVRICEELKFAGVDAYVIGDVNFERRFRFVHDGLEMDSYRRAARTWFKTFLPARPPSERGAEGVGALCQL